MFRSSLFLKTFSTIVLGVVCMATVYYICTVPMINDMAFEMEARAGQNVLDNMHLLVRQSYTDLESWRQSATRGHKRELKNIINVVESYIRDIRRDIDDGRISEAEGRRLILRRIRTMKYGNNDYVWVSDYNSRLISHPDPKLQGKDFSKVKDVHGNLIVPPMVEGARKNGDGYYSYWWRRLGEENPVEKLSYYRNMPDWQWVIGTGVYIDDITKAYKARRSEQIAELKKHLHKIKIAGEGYLYIFDSKMNMIIHPNPNIENTNFADLRNPVTGKPIGLELIGQANTRERKLEYKWDKPADPGNYAYDKISWVRYFEGTDWYICSSVYTDDLKRSAKALTNRIVFVSFIALLLSILAGYFFVRAFTLPIRNLATMADRISHGDLDTAPTHFNRRDEIGTLARAFSNMVDQLRDQIMTLEERVAERTAELSGWVAELERRNREMEALNAMGDMLQSSKTDEEICNIIVKTTRALFKNSAGQLLIRHEQTAGMRLFVSWNGGLREGGGDLYEADDCWCLRRGQTYIMSDSEFHQVCSHVHNQERTPPYICVPIVVRDEVLGILHVSMSPHGIRKDGGPVIDENTRRLTETVAEHCGLSLANLKLRNTLREQSIRDALTKLYNRRHADEVLRREQIRAARHTIKVGLLFIDVDHFKQINDTHGHEAGDEVLRRLGALLAHEFREEDTACRYGGEEFLIILPYADEESCENRAEALRRRVEEELRITWQNKILKITVSVGIAVFPANGTSMQKVVDAADKALYQAKQEGRNRVVMAKASP